MKDRSLRKEFLEQMSRLKTKVMTKAKYKVMNGHSLNGPMILELAQSYITALNEGCVPNIESAWSNVCHFEQKRALKDSVKYFHQEIVRHLKASGDSVGNGNIRETLKLIKEKASQHLKANFIGDIKEIDSFENKLKADIKK